MPIISKGNELQVPVHNVMWLMFSLVLISLMR